MVLYMRDGGKIAKLMARADLYMQMEIYTMDTGETIRLTALVSIVT